jgi:hypothetical protein
MNASHKRGLLLTGMILAAALSRMVPYLLNSFGISTLTADGIPDLERYPWNFSPIAAMCLFGGAHFTQRRWAFLVPFLAMLVSNLGIALLMNEFRYTFYWSMVWIYGSFALTVWIGAWLQNENAVRRISNNPLIARIVALCGAAIISELAFFLITNFSHWLSPISSYTRDLTGLAECYVAAIPFLKYSLAGMAIYGTALFGSLALAENMFPVFGTRTLAHQGSSLRQPTMNS